MDSAKIRSGKSNRAVFLPVAYDAAASGVAWLLAFAFRFNFNIPDIHWQYMINTFWAVMAAQTWLFWVNGLYRGIWRYFSLSDARKVFISVAVSLPMTVAVLFFMNHLGFVPRLVWPLDAVILMALMVGGRAAVRLAREQKSKAAGGRLGNGTGSPVVILGAGEACVGLLREFAHSSEWNVVALFDDDPTLHGKILYGVKVVGAFDSMAAWTAAAGVGKAIIALPSASPAERRRAVDVCKNAGVIPLTVPAWGDILSGKVTVSSIRQVELEDLLGRGPVVLDTAGLHGFLEGQVVLVSGAGGSIGSELCRKIAQFKPKLLVFYELSEPNLYSIEQEFSLTDTPFVAVIGDVKNEERLDWVLKKYRPAAVFHAAAYKHVPLMENENAWEVVRNNVLGTYAVAKASLDNGVKKFVLVSTDKAVNPTNVMGATKRMAEMVCQWLQTTGRMQIVIVRFGNVLGSVGSVIPKFREQIAKGGPVTVTHPEIKRFFMSIPEAAQLVLQAGLMGQGGEIFVLDMGTPIKIADLAKLMIRLSGFTEDEIKVTFTGLRPGEKLYEELMADGEVALTTPHPKLRIARSREVDAAWFHKCMDWLRTRGVCSDEDVRKLLREFVVEYRPAGVKVSTPKLDSVEFS